MYVKAIINNNNTVVINCMYVLTIADIVCINVPENAFLK